MNRIIQTTLIWLLFPLLTLAYQPTNANDNESNQGSREPEKRKIAWIHPGNLGSSQFWNFNRDFKVNNRKSETTSKYREEWMTGRENETLHQYFLLGDSLICTGYENEMTTVKFSKPQTLLRFPINFGQSYNTDFEGRGEFARNSKSEEALQMTFSGDIMTMADGWGRLVLPGGDTLTNVFRVHIMIRSFRRTVPLTADFDINASVNEKANDREGENKENTSWIVEDVYRWYVGQSRFPVFETQETRVVSENEPVVTQRSAFVYSGDAQRQSTTSESDNLLQEQDMDLSNVKQ